MQALFLLYGAYSKKNGFLNNDKQLRSYSSVTAITG